MISAVSVIQLISYTYKERFHWAACQISQMAEKSFENAAKIKYFDTGKR
jgi:hypothetical protein